VTRYGRPIAVIRRLAKEDLENLTMLTDPGLRNGLEEGRADVTVGRVSGLNKLITDVEAKL